MWERRRAERKRGSFNSVLVHRTILKFEMLSFLYGFHTLSESRRAKANAKVGVLPADYLNLRFAEWLLVRSIRRHIRLV